MSERFHHRLRVRFNECDPQGVVFNANYLVYYDVAMTEFHREVLGPYEDLADRGLEMVIAQASLRFFGSAKFDDELQLELGITKLGRSSLGTELSVRNGPPIVEGAMRYVFIDRARRHSQPIPADIRELLQPYAPEPGASGLSQSGR